MTIDTTKLRDLAMKATPGPWLLWATEWNLYLVQSGREGDGSIVDIAYSRRNDIDYIAAANPATVLRLLDRLTRTQESLDIASAALSAAEREVRRLRTIEAAARNIVKVKGRHHSEIAMNQLLEALK